MEVILLEHVDNLGNFGDIVKVKNGYARNFLLPKNKCLRATNENKAQFESQKAKMAEEIAAQRQEALTKSGSIEGIFVVLLRQAGEDGRLFGSVSAKDVAQIVTAAKGIAIDKQYVRIDKPIKYIGVHLVKIKLHADVVAEVRVNVARSEDEAKELEQQFLNPPVKAPEFTPAEEPSAETVFADGAEEKPKKGKKSRKAEAETTEVTEEASEE